MKTIHKIATGASILALFFLIGVITRAERAEPSVADETTAPTSESPEATHSSSSVFEPAYLALHRSGELARRGDQLWQIMESCRLCPRQCGVNRLAGEGGFCRAPGSQLVVASAFPHYGEERPLVGRGGQYLG